MKLRGSRNRLVWLFSTTTPAKSSSCKEESGILKLPTCLTSSFVPNFWIVAKMDVKSLDIHMNLYKLSLAAAYFRWQWQILAMLHMSLNLNAFITLAGWLAGRSRSLQGPKNEEIDFTVETGKVSVMTFQLGKSEKLHRNQISFQTEKKDSQMILMTSSNVLPWQSCHSVSCLLGQFLLNSFGMASLKTLLDRCWRAWRRREFQDF